MNLPVMVSVLAIVYLFTAIWLGLVLKFDFMRSDVLGYVNDSLAWQTPFNIYHVPAYPLLLALLRGVSFGMLPNLALMMGINVVSFFISTLLVYRLILLGKVSEQYALLGAYLFALWPFVGLVYAVYPIADLPVLALFLAGLYLLLKSQSLAGFLLLGLSFVTHKGIWPFVALVAAAYLLHYKPLFSWHKLVGLLLVAAPIGLLTLFGWSYHGYPDWMIKAVVELDQKIRAGYPVLDGVIATMMAGGLRAVVKGGLNLALMIASSLLLYWSFRKKTPFYLFSIAITASILIAFLILNQSQLWAAVRFGRLLVLPLMWNIRPNLSLRFSQSSNMLMAALALILLVASQFAFSWYMASVYFE